MSVLLLLWANALKALSFLDKIKCISVRLFHRLLGSLRGGVKSKCRNFTVSRHILLQ